jgi:hypothetical protein
LRVGATGNPADELLPTIDAGTFDPLSAEMPHKASVREIPIEVFGHGGHKRAPQLRGREQNAVETGGPDMGASIPMVMLVRAKSSHQKALD